MPNYRALYEDEQIRRLAAEHKYDKLMRRLRPLLQTINDMGEPARRIEQVMREVGSFHRRGIKEEPGTITDSDKLARRHKELAEKHR